MHCKVQRRLTEGKNFQYVAYLVFNLCLCWSGSLIFTQLLITGWVEGKRWADLKNPGSQGDGSFLGITSGFKGVSNGYPGTPNRLWKTLQCRVLARETSHREVSISLS